MNRVLSDLLGLDPIYDGIQHRWNQNADVSQQDVDVRRNVASKPLSKSSEDGRPIKEDDDADVGATCAESFLTGIVGRHVEDSMENQHIGDKD